MEPLEVAITLKGDSPDAFETIRSELSRADIFCLGQPAGQMATAQQGSESDLLHFTGPPGPRPPGRVHRHQPLVAPRVPAPPDRAYRLRGGAERGRRVSPSPAAWAQRSWSSDASHSRQATS